MRRVAWNINVMSELTVYLGIYMRVGRGNKADGPTSEPRDSLAASPQPRQP